MKKRIISLLLIILQIMLIASSCTQKNEPVKQGQSVKSIGAISNKTTVFTADMIPIPGERTFLGMLSYTDGTFSFLGSGSNGYYLYSFNDTAEKKTTDDVPSYKNWWISAYQALPDDRYMSTHSETDNMGNCTAMRIAISLLDYGKIFSVTAESLVGDVTYSYPMSTSLSKDFRVVGASVSKDNNDEYVLVTSLGVFLLDSSGNVKSSILPESSFVFVKSSVTSSGEVIILQYDTMTGKAKLSFADMDEGKLSDFTGDITKYITWQTQLATGTGKYSLYFTGNNNIYGVITDKNTAEAQVQVVNLIDSNVNPSRIESVVSVSDEKFVIYMRNDSYDAELYMLTMIPSNKLVQKTPVVLAHNSSGFQYNQEVMDFNKNSDTYKIEFKDYSIYNDQENYDYFSGMQMLVNEIIAGDIPDIMYFDMYHTSNLYINLRRKGVFADLYTLFDNDPDVSRETVVPFIREPFEVDGKLHQLVVQLVANTCIAERADIPYDTWSYEKMFELMDSLDENTIITDWTLLSSVSRGSDLEIGGYLLSESLSDFIDYENATVSFGSDTFVKILEKLKEGYSKREKLISGGSEYKAVISGIGVGAFDSYIQSQYNYSNNSLRYNDPITIPHLSTEDQTIADASSVISSNISFCITEEGENKDGAWEFFKHLISEEVQDKKATDWVYTAPINQNSYDKYIDGYSSIVYYFMNGSQFKSDGKVSKSMYDYYGKDLVEVIVTQEVVDTYKKLLYNAKGKQEHDYALHGILLDEILPFMSGENDKTAEQVAKTIQSRASIFISETN